MQRIGILLNYQQGDSFLAAVFDRTLRRSDRIHGGRADDKLVLTK
jgi:hypothetical protein